MRTSENYGSDFCRACVRNIFMIVRHTHCYRVKPPQICGHTCPQREKCTIYAPNIQDLVRQMFAVPEVVFLRRWFWHRPRRYFGLPTVFQRTFGRQARCVHARKMWLILLKPESSTDLCAKGFKYAPKLRLCSKQLEHRKKCTTYLCVSHRAKLWESCGKLKKHVAEHTKQHCTTNRIASPPLRYRLKDGCRCRLLGASDVNGISQGTRVATSNVIFTVRFKSKSRSCLC